MIKYIFLLSFVAFTTIHLYATKRNAYFLRGCTKGYILFSLLAFYILYVGEENASWFVVLAIIFSFLGDMFLIPKNIKWFAIGGVCFLISHLFFIFSYAEVTDFSKVPIYAIIPIGLVFITATIIIFKKLNKFLPKTLFYPMLFYLLCNGGMNSFAIYRFISGINLASIITVVGALLFFVSDTALFFVRFNKNSIMKTHFLVMITYSIAELLIILGFIL